MRLIGLFPACNVQCSLLTINGFSQLLILSGMDVYLSVCDTFYAGCQLFTNKSECCSLFSKPTSLNVLLISSVSRLLASSKKCNFRPVSLPSKINLDKVELQSPLESFISVLADWRKMRLGTWIRPKTSDTFVDAAEARRQSARLIL